MGIEVKAEVIVEGKFGEKVELEMGVDEDRATIITFIWVYPRN